MVERTGEALSEQIQLEEVLTSLAGLKRNCPVKDRHGISSFGSPPGHRLSTRQERDEGAGEYVPCECDGCGEVFVVSGLTYPCGCVGALKRGAATRCAPCFEHRVHSNSCIFCHGREWILYPRPPFNLNTLLNLSDKAGFRLRRGWEKVGPSMNWRNEKPFWRIEGLFGCGMFYVHEYGSDDVAAAMTLLRSAEKVATL